jgi:hypothetical protein
MQVLQEEVSCHQISFLSAYSVSRFLLSADLPFCHQILSANFCRQQLCFLSANVFADVMEMTLTAAYAVSRPPASCRKCVRLRPAHISLLSRFPSWGSAVAPPQLSRVCWEFQRRVGLAGDDVLYLNIGPPYPNKCACSLWSCSVAGGRDRKLH